MKLARQAQADLEAAEAATERARHNRDRLVVILCRRTPVPVVAAWVGLSRQTVSNILARWDR